MNDELLSLVRAQAEEAATTVRAGALLRIARVMTASDRAEARRVLELGIDAVRGIPGDDGEVLRKSARVIAAAVAPDLMSTIPADIDRPHRRLFIQFEPERLGQTMLDHGLVDAAIEYLDKFGEQPGFPFGVAHALVFRLEDDERRLAAFRRAIEAWRATLRRPVDRRSPGAQRFLGLFESKWELLPREEAEPLMREIVQATLAERDFHGCHSWGHGGGVQIASSRQATLFRILHVVKHLDEPLANSLLASHEELAKAAARFPFGMETIREEARARERNQAGTGKACGFGFGGASRNIAYLRALLQATDDGDFRPAFAAAVERYREDTSPENPNEALKESWPSSCMFRQILYKAGKRCGEAAAAYAGQIPDNDQRLFATIELAAALAGLPELQETQRTQGKRSRARNTVPPAAPATEEELQIAMQRAAELRAEGVVFRCPRCEYRPPEADVWMCRCGRSWNTFTTGGICPGCRHRWKVMACASCREWSPHPEWYVKKTG
ncbi:MAG TPA: hypothetical protein VHC90_02345 [Bryobacteraceae bacterium]|nr:hypothetical protein [Bryobacteraceae bacterium]